MLLFILNRHFMSSNCAFTSADDAIASRLWNYIMHIGLIGNPLADWSELSVSMMQC